LEPHDAASGTILVTDRFSAGLQHSALSTDVAEFAAALAAAQAAEEASERSRILARAVDLYHGPLLATLAQAGDPGQALPYALHAVSADPLREESHRAVMRVFAALGQPDAAQRQFHELQRLLKGL
jgi:DNA-binding SARP family transcriptional activator